MSSTKIHTGLFGINGGRGDNSAGGGHTGGGNPPGDDKLEARVEKLEAAMIDTQLRMIRLESKFDAFNENSAKKADLAELATSFHKSMNEQTWKFLAGATSMAALFSAIAFGLARFLS